MDLVFVKEDGTGRADANSYASVADGDAYFAGHVYPAPWSPPPNPDTREAALVMATRLIDAYCEFLGVKRSASQALQWPRVGVVDRDSGAEVSADAVPVCVVQATCELARELLRADRTGAPLGEGLKTQMVSGSMFVFDKSDRRPVLTATVQALLARVVVSGPGRASVRLVRV